MTLTNKSLELLKTDTSGRVRTTPERREALLDEFERSGLSGMRFAARHGLTYPTFASWAARRRKERMGMEEQKAGPAPCTPRGAAAPVKPVRWLEAVTDDAGAVPVRGVVLHLPGGVRMEVAHADQAPLAAALLRALGAGGGCATGAPATPCVKTASPAPSC
ncbi:MAG: hypothetical protein JWM59_2603 [Verrucomicrobiales bacterium]|nr:hypothetical protein [Verrucomicrobiales bacterium]